MEQINAASLLEIATENVNQSTLQYDASSGMYFDTEKDMYYDIHSATYYDYVGILIEIKVYKINVYYEQNFKFIQVISISLLYSIRLLSLQFIKNPIRKPVCIVAWTILRI